MNEYTTSIEDVKRLLLSGMHITKKDLEAANVLNSSCLPQRIYDLKHVRKYGCLDWDIKWRSAPGKGSLREYWLEPEEIQRIKGGFTRRKENNEQLVEPNHTALDSAQKEPKKEIREQLGLGLLGGHNY